MNKIKYVISAIIVVAVAVLIIVGCRKETTCTDCTTPDLNIEQIKSTAGFIGNCHNEALDYIVPIAKEMLQRDGTINYDSISSRITDFVTEKCSKYCQTETSNNLINTMHNIEQENLLRVKEAIKQYNSDDNYVKNVINKCTTLTQYEKEFILRIFAICDFQDYDYRCKQFKVLNKELSDNNYDFEILHYVLSVAMSSSDYWENYFSSTNDKSMLGRILGMDVLGGIVGVLWHGSTCTGLLVFGPGGLVTCLGGHFVWGAIEGSTAEVLVIIGGYIF